jgi:hypothetical protein
MAANVLNSPRRHLRALFFRDRLEAPSYFERLLQNRSMRSKPFSRFAMLVA